MAGNTGGIRAGGAYVEATLRDASLVAGLKSTEARLKRWGSSIAGVGAKVAAAGTGIVVPFLAAAKAFADAGSELADASSRTGASVEALSALKHGAEQTGASLGDVETGIRKTQKALGAAAGGSKEARQAFLSLGLSSEDLLKKSPDQQFEAVARAIGKLSDPTEKAAIAMTIFGKSGTALIPLADNLDALTGEAKKFGLVWSGDEVDQADKLGDTLDLMTKVGWRLVGVIGSALAPDLTDMAGTIARLTKTVIDWVNENKGLIVTAFKLGAALAVAGTAIVGLGLGVSVLGTAVGGLAAALGVAGAVLGAIVSPLGLVTIGLAAGAVAFFKYTDAGQGALASLSGAFGELRADAEQAFGGIADALKAGDIQLAGQVLWAALQVEWLKGTQFLRGVWADWGNSFVDVFDSATFAISGLMVDLWAGIQSVWATGLSNLSGSWGFLIETILKSIGSIAPILAQVFGVDIKGLIDKATGAVGSEADRKKALAGQLGGIEGDRQTQHGQLDADQARAAAGRRAASAEGLAAGAKELEDAQAALKALTDEAARKAAGVGGGGLNPKGIGEGLDFAKQKVEASGTFSATAVAGLGRGGGNPQVDEQKITNQLLRSVDGRLRRGGFVADAAKAT